MLFEILKGPRKGEILTKQTLQSMRGLIDEGIVQVKEEKNDPETKEEKHEPKTKERVQRKRKNG